MNALNQFAITALVFVSLFVSKSAVAAGFEKNIMWSGRHAGAGGTALSFVEGSEALYFNPAGLVSTRVGQDVSLNASAVMSKFEGPVRIDNSHYESKSKTSVPFGLIYSQTLNEKIGFGIGGYISGGSSAEYTNVTFSPALPNKADLLTDIQIYELAAGIGYQLLPGLKLGAAYRVGFVNADFNTVIAGATATPAQPRNIKLKDLKDQNFAGFKLGAQYSPSKIWGVGVMVRSEFKFDLEGEAGGKNLATGADLGTGDAAATAYLPLAVSLGGHWQLVPEKWQIALEYIWTDYSKDDALNIVGATNGTSIDNVVSLKWKDQHAVRLGSEYLRWALPVRLGYVFTSKVTPDSDAAATFTAPGVAHTVTAGTGYGFMENTLNANLAVDYTWVKGDVDASSAAAAGEYKTNALVIHAGLAYLF